VKAVIAYEKKNGSAYVPKELEFDQELEKKRKSIVRSFSIAKNMYSTGRGRISTEESELEAGAEFLQVQTGQQSYQYPKCEL
jgi:hypothetical protein